jgi:hypothetical protein
MTRYNLLDAILHYFDLRSGLLSSAEDWTNQQLTHARSLVGATLPDGRVIIDKDWEEFLGQNMRWSPKFASPESLVEETKRLEYHRG